MAKRGAQAHSFPKVASTRVSSGSRSIPDSTETFLPVIDWLGGEGKDPALTAERRAESLITENRGVLREFRIDAKVARRSQQPGLVLHTSTRIGALPLLSPVTGRVDFGLVIEPRFQWSSVGEMLAGMGFRIVPDLLPLPEPPQSERRVPPWVLSSIVLERMERLLQSMQRRFVVVTENSVAPRGAVMWDTYATSRFPRGRALDVPCRFPDLREHEELRSAMTWVLHRHRSALQGQRAAGIVVSQLLLKCDELLTHLRGAVPRMPTAQLRGTLQRQSVSTRVFREGLQAIEWTAEERGLAGLSDLAGLSWRLDMEVFFEAWVESIADRAARRVGARLMSGRRNQTKVPLDWAPPSLGSQHSLVPDIVLHREDVVLVIDAKYKRHAGDIERFGWHGVDTTIREQHREDILQALAYSTLFDAPRVVACLAYPASVHTWQGLFERDRVYSRARVRTGGRQVELALLAVPLSGQANEPAGILEHFIRDAA